MVEGRQEKEED